jgi:prefoldin subunit 5
VKAAQRNTAAAEEELLQAKRQLQALRAEMAEREQETFRLKAAVAERDEANHRLDTDVRYLRRQVDDLHGKMTVKDETIAALEGREQQLRDQLHGAQRRLEAALRGSGGGAGLSTPSPVATGRPVTASLGATATSLSAGASTPRGSAYGSGGDAYAASPSAASRYTSNRVDPYAAPSLYGGLSSAATEQPRNVLPSRGGQGYEAAGTVRSAAAARAAYRSPPRKASPPNVQATAAASSSTAPTRPSAGASTQFNVRRPDPALSDTATTEKLKAWEARIATLLSTSRDEPTSQPTPCTPCTLFGRGFCNDSSTPTLTHNTPSTTTRKLYCQRQLGWSPKNCTA